MASATHSGGVTMENMNFILAGLNVIVAVVGVLFIVFTVYEVSSLRKIRRDFERIKKELKEEIYKTQKSMQRVIASYQMLDVDQRIETLSQAVELDPMVFNGFNSLGYAYIEKNDLNKAIDAFNQAIRHHPEDKAGCFDLAWAHLKAGDQSLCLKYLKKAVEVDPTSKKDLAANQLFSSIHDNPRYQELFH
jgi:tetratricopeptide (TPR) repeat protein